MLQPPGKLTGWPLLLLLYYYYCYYYYYDDDDYYDYLMIEVTPVAR